MTSFLSVRHLLPIAAIGWCTACGGEVATGTSDSGPMADAWTGDAGWSQCSAPDGLRVCGGPSRCPDGQDAGCACLIEPPTPIVVTACVNDTTYPLISQEWFVCPWDRAIVELGHFACVPTTLATLFLENGGGARAHFTDFATWGDTPIPSQDGCPSTPGVKLCGGGCGSCSGPDGTCTGRSPLHPYGFCAAHAAGSCGGNYPQCREDQGCFTFKVDPGSQKAADEHGYCLPLAECVALASGLPGGGTCIPAGDAGVPPSDAGGQ